MGLAALSLPAWLLPAGAWPSLSRQLAAVSSPLLRRRSLRVLAAMDVAGDAPGALLYRQWIALRIEEQLQYLREHRPGGWQPELAIAGAQHLDQALSRGHGAILWIAPQVMASLLIKRGLSEAGYPMEHLSREFHGPSDSRFGRRMINPIANRAEDRYLAHRHAMQPGHELKALRPLVRALKQGRIVSISCASYGQRLAPLALLGGELPVATGAASLAVSSGAALLPVLLQREGTTSFRIQIEAPLQAKASTSRASMIDSLLSAYAKVLNLQLAMHAAEFADWRLLRPTGAP
jgi:lauroyl/myristoyl acyltransferase